VLFKNKIKNDLFVKLIYLKKEKPKKRWLRFWVLPPTNGFSFGAFKCRVVFLYAFKKLYISIRGKGEKIVDFEWVGDWVLP